MHVCRCQLTHKCFGHIQTLLIIIMLIQINLEFIGDGAYKLRNEVGEAAEAKKRDWERKAKVRFEAVAYLSVTSHNVMRQ